MCSSDLMDAVGVIKLSKAVIRNIKENLFWAFFYNSIGIPLAAGVLYPIWGIKLNPMFGAAAMSLSSVCVVCNALRLKRLKLNKGENYSENPNNNILDKQKNISSSNKERKDNMSENGIVKTISIEGMMCSHCTGTVEKALNAVDGVNNVTVSLENKNAVVTVDDTVTDKQLKEVVTNAGYKVTGIK